MCQSVVVRKAIRFSQVQSEPASGPEIWTVDRIVDNHVPPIQAPSLRAFGLLLPLADRARNVVGNLPRADRALY